MDDRTFIIVYDFVLFVAFFIAAWIVTVTWRWRQAPGSKALMIMMIGEGWWTLCYALQLSPMIRPEPYFWSKLMFLGVVMVPAGFLVWAARHTKYEGWLNKFTISLLFIEPLVYNIIVWTDPWHKWFSGDFATTGILGIAFWLHTLYSYVLLTVGGVMLFLNLLQVTKAHRMQALLVFLGLPLSSVANIITVLGIAPVKSIDFSPIGFFVAGIIFTYAQLRHRLFDLIPLARNKVLENMLEGVIVLDIEDRIIDANKSGEKILGATINEMLGKEFYSVLPAWQNEQPKTAAKIGTSFVFEGSQKRFFELSATTLYNNKSQPYGKLVILRDITDIKNIQIALKKTNETLSQKLAEIEALQVKLKEEAIRDPLTGLYNRRFLQETLKRELAHTVRGNLPLSIAMLDLDHFKIINDTYGHSVGDIFLVSLANLLLHKTRSSDVCCRYGGEEFVIVMPAATLGEATTRIDQLRLEFSKIKIETGDEKTSITLSGGVAGYPVHGNSNQALLDAADRALYEAKNTGRNRVVVAKH
ncbi:MAG TPA: diguanylate cyclase [Smithellaceae bacterium]|nr:diguanylate cyclase [Smithellaceae bacterium]HOD30079.1 diguanylate cyclase [Smithellaceae bacterium]